MGVSYRQQSHNADSVLAFFRFVANPFLVVSFSSNQPPKATSLIEYPSRFPIKVMGEKVDGLVHAITMIAAQFDPQFDATTVELRESKGGKYLGVTITITATSRDQLDELYRTLSTHPLVKVVL